MPCGLMGGQGPKTKASTPRRWKGGCACRRSQRSPSGPWWPGTRSRTWCWKGRCMIRAEGLPWLLNVPVRTGSAVVWWLKRWLGVTWLHWGGPTAISQLERATTPVGIVKLYLLHIRLCVCVCVICTFYSVLQAPADLLITPLYPLCIWHRALQKINTTWLKNHTLQLWKKNDCKIASFYLCKRKWGTI